MPEGICYYYNFPVEPKPPSPRTVSLKSSTSLYIAFNEKYDIDLPDGFFWDGWNIRCKYVGNTIAELQNDKSGKIQLIRNYVEKLPSLY